MKKIKKLLVMLMLMTLTMGLIGCSAKDSQNNSNGTNVQNPETNNEANETTPEVTEEPSVSTEVTYPVDVTDSNGRVVTLNSEPEKIVSVAPNMSQLVYALGDGDKLIGRSSYCDDPAEVLNVPSIGSPYSPDVEAIIALEPDLVLVSTHFDEENVTKLEELGINVMFLYEEHDMNGVYTMIETLGTTLNRVEEATAMVDDMKATFDKVEKAVEGKERPTVYYVVSYGEESGDFTATGDTFVHGLITLAGGDNIAKDATGWGYSLESLLEADPEIIIVSQGTKSEFVKAEHYKELTAVKEDRVYEIDSYHLLDRQGNRNAEAVLELAKIFYPDAIQ